MKLRNITNIKDPKITLPESMAKKVQKLEELKGAYQSLNNWKKEMQEIDAMRIDENLINNDLIEMAKMHYQNINNQKSPLHSNSKEFKNMEKALQTIANWNSKDEIERRKNDKNAPQTMKEAMEDLKRVSLEYKLEKKSSGDQDHLKCEYHVLFLQTLWLNLQKKVREEQMKCKSKNKLHLNG